MGTPTWHGTSEESRALLAAIGQNCFCELDSETGARITTCQAHQLMFDQRALDGLVFMRQMRERLTREEGL